MKASLFSFSLLIPSLLVTLHLGCGRSDSFKDDANASDVKIVGGKVVTKEMKVQEKSSTVAILGYVEIKDPSASQSTTGPRKLAFRKLCSGTLLSPNVVLTAAHCVITEEGKASATALIIAFDSEVKFNKSPTAMATHIAFHKEFKFNGSKNSHIQSKMGTTHDIALIKLNKKAPLVSYQHVDLVSANENYDLEKAKFIAAGFGSTESPSDQTDLKLRSVDLKLDAELGEQKTLLLSGKLIKEIEIKETEIARNNQPVTTTKKLAIYSGVCSGDSGGPTYYVDGDGKYVLAGVNSFAMIKSLGERFPRMYCMGAGSSDLRKYAHTIQETIANLENEPMKSTKNFDFYFYQFDANGQLTTFQK